jgi:murein DD-endopeptidase MepM/ murein hydrolase activator NlpD
MKIIKAIILIGMLLSTQYIIVAKDSGCDPDQSIENQKNKSISDDAKILLAKIVKDKISLTWPVEVCKCWVSSLFGMRKSGFHNGVDLAAPQGTPVYASADGVVEVMQISSDPKGYGNMILLAHKNSDYKTRYAHLHEIFVQQGKSVSQGEQIGTVGATGHVIAKTAKSDPSHLHFELYRGSGRINPLIALFATDKNWVKSQS